MLSADFWKNHVKRLKGVDLKAPLVPIRYNILGFLINLYNTLTKIKKSTQTYLFCTI